MMLEYVRVVLKQSNMQANWYRSWSGQQRRTNGSRDRERDCGWDSRGA